MLSSKPSVMLSKAIDECWGHIWKGNHEKNSIGNLKVALKLMGDVALDDLNTKWIMDLRKKLMEDRGASDGTVNRYYATISKFLQWATDAELRTSTETPKMKKAKESEGRIRWFTDEEEKEMLSLLPERSRKLVRFAMLTGGRKTELLQLRPDSVFADRIILWGQRSDSDERTKSGKSRPILLTKEGTELADWLVTKGNMPTAQQLRKDWKAMRDTKEEWQKDPEFVFHGCRHTFAVRAVEAGVPIRVLQKWLGHETIEMTEKYGKVTGKALESARDLMFAPAMLTDNGEEEERLAA